MLFFRFIKAGMNIIDLLGVIPYFLSLGLSLVNKGKRYKLHPKILFLSKFPISIISHFCKSGPDLKQNVKLSFQFDRLDESAIFELSHKSFLWIFVGFCTSLKHFYPKSFLFSATQYLFFLNYAQSLFFCWKLHPTQKSQQRKQKKTAQMVTKSQRLEKLFT